MEVKKGMAEIIILLPKDKGKNSPLAIAFSDEELLKITEKLVSAHIQFKCERTDSDRLKK